VRVCRNDERTAPCRGPARIINNSQHGDDPQLIRTCEAAALHLTGWGWTSFRARITMIWVMNVASFQAAWMRYMIWLFEDESCGYNYNTNTSSICPPTLHENGTFHFQRNVKKIASVLCMFSL
jgi:hypothetical protein